MRRIASLVLVLALGGCVSDTWWNPPFTGGTNPHKPAGDSETMRRVMGEPVEPPPLTPQAGDIWPGPLPPTPTLQDIEKQGNLGSMPEQPVPGSPMTRGATGEQPPSPPPSRARGSSTPPSNLQAHPPLTMPPPSPAPSGTAASPPPAGPGGRVVQTPSGPGVTTGGSQGYQTMTMPNGGSAIVIPNGNGTSTVIRSDGTIDTIPTPK